MKQPITVLQIMFKISHVSEHRGQTFAHARVVVYLAVLTTTTITTLRLIQIVRLAAFMKLYKKG
jgi:hypothetical protein